MMLVGIHVEQISSDEDMLHYLAETIQDIKSSPDFYPFDHQVKIELLAYFEPEFLAVRDKVWAKWDISAEPYGLMPSVPARREVIQGAEGPDLFKPIVPLKQIEQTAIEPDFLDSEFSKAFEKAAWLKEKARERLDIEQLPIKTIAEYNLKKEALRVLDLEIESIRAWLKNKGDVSSKFSYACPVTLHGEAEQADAKCPDQFKPALYQHPLGGAPKSSITEAVEWAFAELSETGNTEIIKPGKIKFFLQYLKECITEGNPNFSDYVAERIKEIKAVNGDCQLIMQNLTDKDKLQSEKTGKNRVIKKTRISAILSELRDKK